MNLWITIMEAQTLSHFIVSQLPELWVKLVQQLYLVGIASCAAIVIGIPLGIWVARSAKVRGPILGVAGVLQTIPSLALLAFLLPFTGIGALPAIIALSLYALLPIIRNTLTGLQGISPEIIEAAKGVGFTSSQRLWMVEIPLALPTIIAGIRTAAVISVGVATLAAFIGAGGLGDFPQAIYYAAEFLNSHLFGNRPTSRLCPFASPYPWSHPPRSQT